MCPPVSSQPPPFPAAVTGAATTPSDQALVQGALEHVQKIFRGNGVKKDNITILSHKIARHTLNAGTYLELKPVSAERNAPGKISKGQMVASRAEAMKAIDQTMIAAARDAAIKAQIAGALLERPDQGFGLNRQAVPLDFLTKELSWHEACASCHGSARVPCQRCTGRKVEPCIKCNARGLMPCPICRGLGLLQGNKCHRCHGHRYIPCDLCHRTGQMQCRTCNATGAMKCLVCAGQGWKTHTLALAAQGLTYFEYDPKALPKGAADMIEMHGASLATGGKLKITGRVADEKENVLGANYEVSFPYGEIIFQIGKKEAKTHLFGFQGDLIEFPFLLDKMLGHTVAELEAAANDVGSVAGIIQKATRYRVIAQAYLAALRMPVKKAVAVMIKNYDLALSPGMAERLVVLAEQTSSRITRKPRYYGLAAGLGIVALLNAAYYLLPLRAKLAAVLSSPKFDILLDVPMPIIGGIVCGLMIRRAGSRAINQALGHLLPKGQKSNLVPKVRTSGLWGYAGAFVLTLLMMELAATLQTGSPYWYELTRRAILTIAN